MNHMFFSLRCRASVVPRVQGGPRSLLSTNTSSAVSSSTSASSSVPSTTTDEPTNPLSPVYIHHVSKTVLQHLQDQQHEWLANTGLNRLYITPVGTMVLRFPSDNGRIWTSYDSSTKQHWITVHDRRHGTTVMEKILLKDASKLDRPYPFHVVHHVQQQIGAAVDHMIERLDAKSMQPQKTK